MQTESTDVSRTRPETKQKKQPRGRASAMQRFCFRVQQYALGSCSDRRSLASSSMTTRRAALTVTFVSDITAMLSHDFGASETRARPKKKKLGGEQNRNVKKNLGQGASRARVTRATESATMRFATDIPPHGTKQLR